MLLVCFSGTRIEDMDMDPNATGLEQLEALIAAGFRAPIMKTLDFRMTEVEPGRAVFEGVPGVHAYNPQGVIHGSYAAALLDAACACAVHSRLEPLQGYTTLELKIAYHRTMTKDTGLVRAIGTVASIGRRTAFAEARLVGADDKLYASATSTLLIIDPPPS
jgi:uncharacterized protein (TIGR00369 family)